MKISNKSLRKNLELSLNRFFDDGEDFDDGKDIELSKTDISKVIRLNLDVEGYQGATSPIDFEEVLSFPFLESIAVADTFVLKKDMLTLRQLPKLKALMFDHCAFEETEPVEFTSVKHLHLRYCNIADYGFLGGMESLETLYINDSTSGTIVDGGFISKFEHLEVLDISFSDFISYEFLSGLKRLKSLSVEGLQFSRIIEYIPAGLSELYVSREDYSVAIEKLGNTGGIKIYPGRFVKLFMEDDD